MKLGGQAEEEWERWWKDSSKGMDSRGSKLKGRAGGFGERSERCCSCAEAMDESPVEIDEPQEALELYKRAG